MVGKIDLWRLLLAIVRAHVGKVGEVVVAHREAVLVQEVDGDDGRDGGAGWRRGGCAGSRHTRANTVS